MRQAVLEGWSALAGKVHEAGGPAARVCSQSGILRAGAGLSLHELIRVFLPKGFFPPVTPGTSYVTLGGMVASDVHGKTHHVEGCFGEHVASAARF